MAKRQTVINESTNKSALSNVILFSTGFKIGQEI